MEGSTISYTYLLIDLCSIAIPLAWSFESRIKFFRSWKYLMPALLITSGFFIYWDIIFTSWGIWGFNPVYLSGVYWINLPMEEWLFFICIPYACLFTYTALTHFFKRDYLGKAAPNITKTLIAVSVLIALLNTHKAYTFTTFGFLTIFLLLHLMVFKSTYLGRFYFAFLFILLPFFAVNGLLTGSFIPDEIVWYDHQENLGIRMFTIPLEDVFYGLLLILINVTIFEYFKQRDRLLKKTEGIS